MIIQSYTFTKFSYIFFIYFFHIFSLEFHIIRIHIIIWNFSDNPRYVSLCIAFIIKITIKMIEIRILLIQRMLTTQIFAMLLFVCPELLEVIALHSNLIT